VQTAFITFRGEPDVAVEFKDHGYEPDTGSHEIEWWIVDDRFRGGATSDEEEEILERLFEICNDPHRYED
jgi:hypothetical protein